MHSLGTAYVLGTTEGARDTAENKANVMSLRTERKEKVNKQTKSQKALCLHHLSQMKELYHRVVIENRSPSREPKPYLKVKMQAVAIVSVSLSVLGTRHRVKMIH